MVAILARYFDGSLSEIFLKLLHKIINSYPRHRRRSCSRLQQARAGQYRKGSARPRQRMSFLVEWWPFYRDILMVHCQQYFLKLHKNVNSYPRHRRSSCSRLRQARAGQYREGCARPRQRMSFLVEWWPFSPDILMVHCQKYFLKLHKIVNSYPRRRRSSCSRLRQARVGPYREGRARPRQ